MKTPLETIIENGLGYEWEVADEKNEEELETLFD